VDKHLVTLEFPKILDKLTYYAMFSASKELALALQPSLYLSEAQGWQTETSEAAHLLSVKVSVGVGGARDVRPLAGRAQRGAILTQLELLEIRQTLIAARDLQRTITRLAEAYPRLADIAQRIEPCPGLVNDIGQAIDERGEVKSSASAALARIRRDLETAHSRLMERLNRLVA
jgi:DNA mismatch repair protein MutS2